MINIISYNITWFGLIYWGNAFIPVVLLLLCAHVLFFIKTYKEIFFILVVSMIGIYIDSNLQHFGFFIFSQDTHIPFWLMFLWASFATTLSHSLRFLQASVWLQILAGLIAPLSYIAGHKFGAVNLGQSMTITYLVLSLIWVALFILLFKLRLFFVGKKVIYE
tara:strand:- start:66 stop:554 length:489 start_codon:yes stop_codon:yes gene_type:complete